MTFVAVGRLCSVNVLDSGNGAAAMLDAGVAVPARTASVLSGFGVFNFLSSTACAFPWPNIVIVIAAANAIRFQSARHFDHSNFTSADFDIGSYLYRAERTVVIDPAAKLPRNQHWLSGETQLDPAISNRWTWSLAVVLSNDFAGDGRSPNFDRSKPLIQEKNGKTAKFPTTVPAYHRN